MLTQEDDEHENFLHLSATLALGGNLDLATHESGDVVDGAALRRAAQSGIVIHNRELRKSSRGVAVYIAL